MDTGNTVTLEISVSPPLPCYQCGAPTTVSRVEPLANGRWLLFQYVKSIARVQRRTSLERVLRLLPENLMFSKPSIPRF